MPFMSFKKWIKQEYKFMLGLYIKNTNKHVSLCICVSRQNIDLWGLASL